jgi:hypothetical protein
MKNLKCLLIAIFFVLNGQTQSNYYAQTFDDKTIPISDSSKCIVLYYNSGSCNLCMKVLILYCKNITVKYPGIELMVMIQGHKYDIIGLRSNTSLIQNYFINENPNIIYDMNDGKRKTYAKLYRISEFPSLLLIDMQKNQCIYISYKKIFSTSNKVEISKYARIKINDFVSEN